VRLPRDYLYGLNPFDPTAFASPSLLWLVIAILASWYSARRASQVDPMVAPKYE
jgi:ABC-type lipoprotein release transport system permease subunit